MKILFITQFLPYPPDTGGKIKTFQTLKLLAKKHQVYLISFVDKKKDLQWEAALLKYCYGMKTFVAPIITANHHSLKTKALKGFFNPLPFRVQKYFLPTVADYIKKITAKEKFDVVHIDHETSVQYLPFVKDYQNKLKVYDEHNISSEGVWGYFKYESNLIKKTAYFIEAVKYWFYEKQFYYLFDKILAISDNDRQKIIRAAASQDKVFTFPVPCQIKNYYYFGAKNILFVGLLSWWPNKDGILWFYHKIYPKIKQSDPQVRLQIIGANPDTKIKEIAAADSSVEVLGYVRNLDKYYKKAGVFISPIRAGAGIRIKILQALSAGIPVVSTHTGATGLNLQAGEEILYADNENLFAESVLKLLKTKQLSEKLSRKGIDFLKKNYSRQKAAKLLDEIYEDNV
jgi:glycosyltransferase involved in cell wall biosynthesis